MGDSDLGQDGAPAAEFSVADHEVTCRQFVELITDYFEGALAPRTLSQVEEHLVMCDWCVTYAEHMRDTVAALEMFRQRPAAEPSEALLLALQANRDTP